jgi:hypothetical protein
VPQLASLFLGEDHDLPCALREALEHRSSVTRGPAGPRPRS